MTLNGLLHTQEPVRRSKYQRGLFCLSAGIRHAEVAFQGLCVRVLECVAGLVLEIVPSDHQLMLCSWKIINDWNRVRIRKRF